MNILVVYDTMTNNTRKFCSKLPLECCHISEYDGISPFVLVTYTINFGQIPGSTKLFLNDYYKQCKGVSSSGNKNWGSTYGKAADLISNIYKVPFISKFELQGTNEDVQIFMREVDKLCQNG
jgi:protein involved in ribonucleotide reduction